MEEKPTYFNKFLMNYLIIILNLFLSEAIFRILSDYAFFEWANLRIFLGTNLIAITLSLFLSLLSKKSSKIISIIISFIFALYTFLQIGFFNYLGAYMSFNTSSQLGAVIDYIIEFFSSLSWTYYLIFVPSILTIIFSIIFRKRIILNMYERKTKLYLSFISIIIILFSFLYVYTINANYMQDELQQVSNKELLKYPSVPSIAIKEFGTITYGILDVKSLFVVQEEPEIIVEEKKEEEVITDYSRIIDDEAWHMTIENNTNSTYKKLDNYFINRNITAKNDYTALFENKNLIIILMESINDIIINEEYFPNFYKLYSEGWAFTNNYSPRNSCATGNNEMSGMTSLYTISDSCTANKYKNNSYYEAIFNLFNKKGYLTTSMHNYTESYYYRSTIHRNMGSGKYYGVQSLKIPYGTTYGKWASDEDFMKKALEIIDKYDESTKFMTWLTTVSSHQPYSVSSPYGDLYYNEFKNTKYNATTKRYLSKVKVLDNALGILVDGLKEQGKLDDTVIVLLADHYPYGLAKSNINQILDYDVNVDATADKTPLVIYNPNLEHKEYSQYTTYMNLTPTIANLFNLEYDPRLYFGQDALSNDYESIVVFADGSWKNEHAYYNTSTGKIKYYDDYYTVDMIKEINNKISLEQKMSTLAIKNNYFNYLNKNLTKYQAVIDENKQKEEVKEEIIDDEIKEENLEERID